MDTLTQTAVGALDRRAVLAARFERVRAGTAALCAPLSPEDAVVQSMTDASPAKWHLAHTSWYFETFVLAAVLPDYQAFHADFAFLFNSYYNSVGEQYSRPHRPTPVRRLASSRAPICRSSMRFRLSSQNTMTWMPSFNSEARRSSACTIARPPSPVRHTTRESGNSSLALIAAGSANPIDDKPLVINMPRDR